MPILLTSLAEIRSFNPCARGWKAIREAHKDAEPFPLIDCLQSNTIADVCWLLSKRKNELQICVEFARACADSVAHLESPKAYAADADAAFWRQKAKNNEFLKQAIRNWEAA
jgi:hypothetical protein